MKQAEFLETLMSLQLYEILARTPYGLVKNGEVGVDRLVNEQVFTAAYPLHEVRCTPRAWSEAAVVPRLISRLMFTMFAGRLSAADPPG